jgi:hypothetical protein
MNIRRDRLLESFLGKINGNFLSLFDSYKSEEPQNQDKHNRE